MNLSNTLSRSCFTLFLIAIASFVYSQEDASILNTEVTIDIDGLSLEQTLAKLETETGVYTAYNTKEVKDEYITIKFEKELLSEVLDAILGDKNLSYKLIGNTVTIFKSESTPTKNSSKKDLSQKVKIEKHTINGYIVDGNSKETLIGANVYIDKLGIGTTTNEFGFYSITVPDGEYEISFSYIGYESLVEKITLRDDVVVSPSLYIGTQLNEVVITDDVIKRRHSEAAISTNLAVDKLESMPMLMGERDLVRLAQLMPGVQSGSEGSTGLYVRGGGPDQNLFLIDGVPIYNINHLFGFLSTLNGDAIKTAEVVKGGFPARYGGRLSSIIDIRMKDGNMEEFHGDIGMGVIAGKFNLEGPLIRDKTSFNISARRTWLDLLTTPIQKAANVGKDYKEQLGYRFRDLNFKINHKFSDQSRLFVSSYLGKDHLNFNGDYSDATEDGDLVWGNRIYSMRWNYQLSPKVFSNTTVYRTQYRKSFNNNYVSKIEKGQTDIFSSKSNVVDYGAKIDINYLPNTNHHIRFGIGNINHQFSPTANKSSLTDGVNEPIINDDVPDKIEANEMSAYVEDDISLGSRLKLNAGLHISYFDVENSNYLTFQPRAAMSVQLSENSSVKVSYSQMRQFVHLLASPGLGFPNDLWVASTDEIKPEESYQYSAGYTRSLGNGYELTLEGYYKSMKNLLEYKAGFSFFTTGKDWENSVLVGDGESYGMELLLEKRLGSLTGWLGYTLSRSDRIFPDIREGTPFPYKYDRRHDVSLALTYKKSERIDMGLVWVYGSGNTYTLGTNNYNAILYGKDEYFASSYSDRLAPVNNVENRNNQRAPAYHRLDLSVNLHKEKKRGRRTWSFGVYNAYSRLNPFELSVEKRRESDELYLKQTSLLAIIPFASYSFKF